ncbi:hypothetical protein BMR02_00620 [Methylococcaceae bacterium HT1]|nr:hypothetical protein BMR02_00620 [Methylococcaceae bacterium HT1]TXL14860.1 hypothetical protein BMR05_05975 [Methylococcaceae bacterium HT4]TXL18315.1 hypothetical protein BMR04_01665 [Methylococcaceae bacterium HT3]TXL20941.1 hypothetical protein BMR06_02740 [Methylococcaceae bacterium HT5]TXL23289.1 hypothetical protein BMR03_03400 [Methylococcaceae bacterium HT2]
MKIVFIRHGKPDLPELGKLQANELHQWIKAYNAASLDTDQQPPKQAVELTKQCNVVVCSNLRRSIESAKLLGIRGIYCIDAIFREVELPYCNIRSPKLSATVWFVLFRILWFMGYSNHSDSKSTVKQRAAIAAGMLHNRALANNSVLLVGHSIFNSYIGKQLKMKGLQGSTSIFSKHWQISVYEYPEL